MSDFEASGAQEPDPHIADQERFLKEVPDLIVKIRMRKPENAWRLDLSSDSLELLDQYLAAEVDQILAKGQHIGEVMNREFVRELAAYVGQVIVRTMNGWWSVVEESTGPHVSFRQTWTSSDGQPVAHAKAVDIYNEVLVTVLEGGSLAKWYHEETA